LKAGKWFAQVVADDGQSPPALQPVKSAIGIDVGLTSFATLSTGEKVENPRFYRKMERKLARQQRSVSRKVKGSSNRRKAVRRLQGIHAGIADARNNFTHHLSKMIVRTNQLIAVEALVIRAMVRGRLSKSILDAAWGQFIFQLTYKAEEAGCQVVKGNPRGTSQECSNCGEIVAKDLSVRVHKCSCGLTLDRDHNAAINILQRAGGGRPIRKSCGQESSDGGMGCRETGLDEAGILMVATQS
jgi:putative transposase